MKTCHWMTGMKNAVVSAILISLAISGAVRASSRDRQPIPFTDAYRDGYVLVLWSSHVDADLKKIIQRVQATGATYLEIPYFGCQSDVNSSDVGSCQVGQQEQAIRAGKIAVSLGMDVTLLPILTTPKWEWRGDFDPTDVDGWFNSYETWLKQVAALAEQLGSQEFIVGSEFSKLYQYEDRWSRLLQDFHGIFHGPLIVTVNWDLLDHSFWADADAIGVSSYHPLSDDDSPDQGTLDSAMDGVKDELMAVSKKWNRPIHITEAGFPSTAAAARTPWLSDASDGVDQDLQLRCYTAFAQAWQGEKALVRASFWATSDPGSADTAYGFETLGKPAEPAVRSFFAARSRLAH